MRHAHVWWNTAAILIVASVAGNVFGFQQEPPGLGDPGTLQGMILSAGTGEGNVLRLAGKDAGAQLVVTGQYDSGQERDLTREAAFEVVPPEVALVDSEGYVRPTGEGTAVITAAHPAGHTAKVTVEVTGIIQDPAVNFPNQIVPIFTKHGCNGGGCHGKSGGQNGFRLSLLGFEPTEDYEYLVKEGRGRRTFPAAPELSLLITKATAEVPHGGGARIEIDSPPYRLLHRWIEQGMPYGDDEDPTVVGIDVYPKERVMGRESHQQMFVLAHYSDGSVEDVTRMTSFESNDTEMAEVTVEGLVTTGKLAGSVAIMCRY